MGVKSATERLRALLDERGVEYDVDDTQVDGNGTMYRVTYVKEGYARTWVYEEPPDCALLVSYNHDLGAEDAIAVTLGSCKCSNSERTSDSDATAERRGDAVEVVRCRDCERFAVDQSDHEYRSGWWCKRWDTDMVKPDGFCAWASRKESE